MCFSSLVLSRRPNIFKKRPANIFGSLTTASLRPGDVLRAAAGDDRGVLTNSTPSSSVTKLDSVTKLVRHKLDSTVYAPHKLDSVLVRLLE